LRQGKLRLIEACRTLGKAGRDSVTQTKVI